LSNKIIEPAYRTSLSNQFGFASEFAAIIRSGFFPKHPAMNPAMAVEPMLIGGRSARHH
jgi:hypothetical protein